MDARGTLRRVVRSARGGGAAAGRGVLDRLSAALGARTDAPPATEPGSIFVLRNNDIGDVLVVTPLFEALRRRFADARIVAGVGDWAADVLRHNPFIDEVLPTNAPWFNKYSGGGGTVRRLQYVFGSPEAAEIQRRKFDLGIDVLGSSWGSLLLASAGIPRRIGVGGYAGGERAATATVAFNPHEHVTRTSLRLAELLGATELPPPRPQLHLTPAELAQAEAWWRSRGNAGTRRVVVGPGGGLPARCWPASRYAQLLALLARMPGELVLIGGPAESALISELSRAVPSASYFDEPLPLRPTFALVATADLVICNSSMLMHAAAAFSKQTLVLLGEAFDSTSRHDEQWGYPATCRTVGKEVPVRVSLAAPAEAFALSQVTSGATK